MTFSQHQEKVNQWLAAIGGMSGKPLKMNEAGLCHMKFGNQLTLVVEVPEGREEVYIYSPLIRIPDYGAKDVLYQAMRMNLFQIETEGGLLSVDPKTDEIVFCVKGNVDNYEYESFQKELDTFLTNAQVLKQKLLDVEPEKKVEEELATPISRAGTRPDSKPTARIQKKRPKNMDFMGIRP